MDALHLLLYQIHQTPPAAFVGFKTVYSQAMDALHLLLYQIHQTPPAAFVGFKTVYSQAMDALHLLLYQIHQTPPAAFVGFKTVYSQAMDALHLLLFFRVHRVLISSWKKWLLWEEPVGLFSTFRLMFSSRLVSWRRLEQTSQNVKNKPTSSSQSHHFFQEVCTQKNLTIDCASLARIQTFLGPLWSHMVPRTLL